MAADPTPTAKAATIPIGRAVPNATPAAAPSPTTTRPRYRNGRARYGEAMTTTAVARASRTARYTGGAPDAATALTLSDQSVPASHPASSATPTASAPASTCSNSRGLRPRANSASASSTSDQRISRS